MELPPPTPGLDTLEWDVSRLLEGLQLIERRLGAGRQPALVEPFDVQPHDALDLQRAGKILASHVGLDRLVFVVQLAHTHERVAGNVELQPGQDEVFITVSSRLQGHPDAVLATLAHEVSHKLLHAGAVHVPGDDPEDERLQNERLTDLGAVWAGFGKLMLNGCKSEWTELKGQTVHTHRWEAGYLRREQLAMAHALVCALRGIDHEQAATGLNEPSRLALRDARQSLNRALRKARGEAASRARTAAAVEERLRERQRTLLAVERDLLWLRSQVLPGIERLLRREHLHLRTQLGVVQDAREIGEAGTPLDLSKALHMALLEERRSLDGPRREQAWVLAHRLARACRALTTVGLPLPPVDPEELRILHCWCDDQKLRLPPGKDDILARCPRCGYRFPARTTLPGYQLPAQRGRVELLLGRLRRWR